MTRAPIALFVYNRPRHTRFTVESLRKNTLAGESDLHIFSDAAKDAQSAVGVQCVRDYIRSVDGFRSVRVIERSSNVGLAASITQGLDELCDAHGRVIVMEDDLECSPHFLAYMNNALDRYANEDRVMQIAGHMFVVALHQPEDALFLPFISSWGWATWGRAWRHYDARATGYDRLTRDGALRRRFDLDGHYSYFKMLKAQQEGRIDSWAIRWYLSVFWRDGLALYPRRSLVRNLGFDGSGVNCNVSDFAQSDLDPTFVPESFPMSIEVSAASGAVYSALPVPKVNWASMLNRAKRILGNTG
jgi:hypothetical protein